MRDPSTLFYQRPTIRRLILVCYWTVIIAALPLWWHTTSIQRLSLPESRVSALPSHHNTPPVFIHLKQDGNKNDVQALLEPHNIVVNAPDKADNVEAYSVEYSDDISVHDRTLRVLTGTSSRELADTLISLISPQFDSHRVVQYAPRYRLAFSFLNEDSAAGDALFGWDITSAIQAYLTPTLRKLEALHNFTIESQVQFHAPLALDSRPLVDGGYGLTPEDLTVFVNSAEWTLSSSVTNDPVLHFVLFLPSVIRRPLHILDSKGSPSSSNAFIVPQWGGITILNTIPPSNTLSVQDLKPIFTLIKRQLHALIGVPPLPARFPRNDEINLFQLDSLTRFRAQENVQAAKDTLKSIVKLVGQIENMPVGEDVKNDVQNALDALEKTFEEDSLPRLFSYSALASRLSSQAFFNPGMLALLYFPAEHKYAVYTPLFASALIPLVGAVVREVARWKKARKETKIE